MGTCSCNNTNRYTEKTPDGELVGSSGATYSCRLAIGNQLSTIDRVTLLQLGNGKTLDSRRKCENQLN